MEHSWPSALPWEFTKRPLALARRARHPGRALARARNRLASVSGSLSCVAATMVVHFSLGRAPRWDGAGRPEWRSCPAAPPPFSCRTRYERPTDTAATACAPPPSGQRQSELRPGGRGGANIGRGLHSRSASGLGSAFLCSAHGHHWPDTGWMCLGEVEASLLHFSWRGILLGSKAERRPKGGAGSAWPVWLVFRK